MSDNFSKFKKKLRAIRIAKSVMAGLAAGMTAGGGVLILSKLAVIDLEFIASLYIGIGALLIAGGLFFLFSRKSDKALAEELDGKFGLKARVQTMVEFGSEVGEMFAMQREDADSVLSEIPLKLYKFKRLWIYITALVLSAALLAGGFILPDMRDYTPPEEVEAFELSELQAASLAELIKYVETSGMEEEFRAPIAAELTDLLARLREIHTVPDMQVTLAETMAVIVDITYKSSTATEMLDALWDTEDVHLRYLAKVLDTSSWSSPDWGDFAEKLTEYISILMGDNHESEDAFVGAPRLKWAIDSMTRRLDIALDASGLPENDEMYAAVDNLFNDQLVGLSTMVKKLDNMSDDEARGALVNNLNILSEATFAAISLNRTNAIVGEYAMTRLASLFLVPIPEFERPEFVRTGESVDGSQGSAGENKENEDVHGGGLGTGATYGSDDYVLDPITGEYVKYGELINKYNALMLEKLSGDYYSEEQKEIIRKYFDLLFSGIEKEEGN